MTKRTADFTYRPQKSGAAKVLGDLEGPLMDIIWQLGSATVREAHEAFSQTEKELAYTTVMTVLSRLSEKGHLKRTVEGKAHRYHPTLSREAFVAQTSGQVFSGLLEELSGPAMSAFVEELSPRETKRLEELAELIAKKRRGREP